jgi:hypothetical protein
MPTSLECFDRAPIDDIPATEQTIDSPDLFTRHPIQDGLQMHLKGRSDLRSSMGARSKHSRLVGMVISLTGYQLPGSPRARRYSI